MILGFAARAGAVVAAMCGLLLATPLQAQEGDPAAPSATDDMLDDAIGCVAAYDMDLAHGDEDAAQVAEARQQARETYALLSGESEGEIQDDIRQAEASLPASFTDDVSFDDYEAGCDAAFMDPPADNLQAVIA